uniref:Uncharacterized protein n=1 Tax=Rhizophora mucronata TaxID=61149 RepID=A0A2P2NN66_RHIMU
MCLFIMFCYNKKGIYSFCICCLCIIGVLCERVW